MTIEGRCYTVECDSCDTHHMMCTRDWEDCLACKKRIMNNPEENQEPEEGKDVPKPENCKQTPATRCYPDKCHYWDPEDGCTLEPKEPEKDQEPEKEKRRLK